MGAVLVLAGGEGRRLGGPKATLDWGGRPLLLHVLDRLAPLAERVVVAARPGQDLPPGGYERVDDALADAGPLAGLAAGLAAIAPLEPAALVAVAACDYPYADPRLFLALAALAAATDDVVLPRHGGHAHPLQALWRARAGAACSAALDRGQRRIRSALESLSVRAVEAAELPGIDPDRALLNLNDPGDLDRARPVS
ncbi:MAG TPA: molybdenum cofactor guanylyltransferase [Gemmatimonadota bacterium]|nr:molybdenum cofactor guanylyltransferase [Gemmatimonadota bacterium]